MPGRDTPVAGALYKRQDGRWIAAIVHPPADGRRGRRQTVSATTRAAARKRRDALLTELANEHTQREQMTVGALLERWLRDIVDVKLAPKTRQSYRYAVDRYIRPAIGSTRLSALQPAAIQALYASVASRGYGEMAKRCHTVLHRALGLAVLWELLDRNPADRVERPRVQRQAMQAFTEQETQRLLAVALEQPDAAMWLLALLNGPRQGELLGVLWADLDLERGAWHVQRSLSYTTGKHYDLKFTKTGKTRHLWLDALVVDALKRHRAAQRLQRLAVGALWEEWGLVFPRADGRPLHPNTVKRRWKSLCKRAGVRLLRQYDCRATWASQMLAQGESIKLVAEGLGHSNAATTLAHYSHVSPSMHREAGKRLAERLLKEER